MRFVFEFQKKLLKKSNSYNHYKDKNERLLKKMMNLRLRKSQLTDSLKKTT